MEIFLTIELFALLIWLCAYSYELSDRTNYHTNDGGWTTYYNYTPKVRTRARLIQLGATALAVIGLLVLIWS